MYRDNDVVLGGLSMRLFSVFCARDTFVLESQLGVILRSCICNVVIAMPYKHSMYSSMKIGELLQTAERQLEETNADGHTVTDLIHLQNELQTSLTQIRSKKTQLMLETVKDLLEKRARMKKKKEEVNGMSDLPPEGDPEFSQVILHAYLPCRGSRITCKLRTYGSCI
ncbi:putative protein MADS AFFECTING FLOWERING 5-like isoform X2 [Capsicum annuum]|nr:putative protein MADS AFFECTING FLOWERING 5-like isoform X2 [Capsicum annuum]